MRSKVSSAKRRPFCLGINDVGHCKQLSTQRPGSPQEHDSTPRRLSSVYPRQATHVLFTKNGPVESECKLNNVNPHIIRNQIQIK